MSDLVRAVAAQSVELTPQSKRDLTSIQAALQCGPVRAAAAALLIARAVIAAADESGTVRVFDSDGQLLAISLTELS